MRILIDAANTAIAVEDGHIVEPSGLFDHVVRAPQGEVRPGLINAHDHLHRNHYGRLGVPPYANAYEWARDIQHRNQTEIALGREWPRREALLFGAWKNLLAGVTLFFITIPGSRISKEAFRCMRSGFRPLTPSE